MSPLHGRHIGLAIVPRSSQVNASTSFPGSSVRGKLDQIFSGAFAMNLRCNELAEIAYLKQEN